MKSCVGLAACFWVILGGSSLAVDCQSAGGHIDGQEATVVRHVVLQGNKLSLTGGFDRSSVLSCTSLAHGLFCRGESGQRTGHRDRQRQHAPGIDCRCDEPEGIGWASPTFAIVPWKRRGADKGAPFF